MIFQLLQWALNHLRLSISKMKFDALIMCFEVNCQQLVFTFYLNEHLRHHGGVRRYRKKQFENRIVSRHCYKQLYILYKTIPCLCKLHESHSLVGKTPCSYGQDQKEQVVLTRCRIGHGSITHSYLLNTEERPECIACTSIHSLKHVLIDWMLLTFVKHSIISTMYMIYLQMSQAKQFLKFLKELILIQINIVR